MNVLIKQMTDYLIYELGTEEIYTGEKTFKGTSGDHTNVWVIAIETYYDHNGPTGLLEILFRFNHKSKTYAGAYALAKQFEDILSGFTGMMGTAKIAAIFSDGGGDTYFDGSQFYVSPKDYRVQYEKE